MPVPAALLSDLWSNLSKPKSTSEFLTLFRPRHAVRFKKYEIMGPLLWDHHNRDHC